MGQLTRTGALFFIDLVVSQYPYPVSGSKRRSEVGASAHRARHVIRQVQVGDGAPHRRRPRSRNGVDLMVGALEEQVRLRQLPVEETQIRIAFRGGGEPRVGAHRAAQPEDRIAGRGEHALFAQEEGQVAHRERGDQPLAGLGQHRIQIGFRAKLLREFDQRAAVIVAVAVEMAVQLLLNPGADRLEQESADQHHDQRRGVTQVVEVDVGQAAEREHDQVEAGQHADGGQRVRVAAAEEDVHVHQPVANDGVGQAQRQQHHREHRQPQVPGGHRAERVRQNVKHACTEAWRRTCRCAAT